MRNHEFQGINGQVISSISSVAADQILSTKALLGIKRLPCTRDIMPVNFKRTESPIPGSLEFQSTSCEPYSGGHVTITHQMLASIIRVFCGIILP